MASRSSGAVPAGIEALAGRYDPDAIDVPGGRAVVRLRVRGADDWDARIQGSRLRVVRASEADEPDAVIAADPSTWMRIAGDVRAGMQAFQRGSLRVRGSLHLGVGFLAATSGDTAAGRLSFSRLRTSAGQISVLSAGVGPDVLLCLHGLGGTKASFLPTVAALADRYRVVAMDLPGFGESDKPIGAAYDSQWFARSAFQTLDALEVSSAHIAGNSMGGRIAIEAGLMDRSRVRSLSLLSPALAWLRDRRWAPVVRLLRPELGLLQVTPRSVTERIVRGLVPGGNDGWVAAGVDEFLRAYFTPRGRAAFYAAARNIYLDQPHGDDGFWSRLSGLSTDALFIWGRHDTLVPIAFMKHVERALPAARHVELDCGHVPQLERPRQTHAAMRDFMRER
ncbi:MAG TPA: alpha/beta fold hydrolase [Thermoleophilaceae bacterium]|nr:alpha/beta fold hydrolase [Thermoleophilaceae bacterium]